MKIKLAKLLWLTALGTLSLQAQSSLPPDSPPPENLRLWVDAQNADGVTNTTLTNGVTLAQWTDNSSYGLSTFPRNGGPIFATNGPLGKPVVRFASSKFLLGNGPVCTNFPFTVFTVFTTTNAAQAAVFGLADNITPHLDEIWTGTSNTFAAFQRREDPSAPVVATNIVNDGLPHIVATRFLSTSNVMMYVDGKLAATDNTVRTNNILSNYGYFSFGGVYDGSTESVYFNGDICEVRVYGVDLSDTERPQIEQRLFAKWVARLPRITQQPLGLTVLAGANAVFTVTATNTLPLTSLSYQWRRDGYALAKETNAVLTVTNVTTTDGGLYTVEVGNPQGSTLSTNAMLTVTLPPVGPSILAQPKSQSVPQGTNVTLSVTAQGTAPLIYQWRKDGVNLSGASMAVLSLPNIAPSQAGNYVVVVSNSINSITSAVAIIQVSPALVPPHIVNISGNLTVTRGSSASFAVTATGSMPLTYQWLKNAAPINGQTTSQLTLTNVTTLDQASYSVVVSNAAAIATSVPASLTVKEPSSGSNTWTILIYGDADNSLSSSLVGDMLEMEQAGSAAGFNIVVQADFNAVANHYGQLPAGLEKGVTRFLMQTNTSDGLYLTSTPLQRLPELNMDDPAVMTDFIHWGITNFPADHYGVVLWNHGGQFLGFGGDQQDGTLAYGAGIKTAQIKSAVTAGMQGTPVQKFDFFAFDTCLMAGAECFVDFTNLSDTYLACAEEDLGPGWNYDATMKYLKANPGVAMRDFATQEVAIWKAHHFSDPLDAQLGAHGAYDLTRYPAFQSAWFAFGTELNKFATDHPMELAAIRHGTTPYWVGNVDAAKKATDFTDLGELAKAVAVSTNATDALRGTCGNLTNAINDMVIAKAAGTLKVRTMGVSVYYPLPGIQNGDYQALDVHFLPGYSWESFLFTVVANYQADGTPPVVTVASGGKSVTIERGHTAPVNFNLNNQTDIARITADLVSFEYTGDPNDAVFLGQVFANSGTSLALSSFQYDGTALKIQGADENISAFLGGFYDSQDINLVTSYAEYLPPDGSDSQFVILQTDLSEGYPRLVGALDGEAPAGLAPRGIELQPDGILTPVYLVETFSDDADPVYSSILANDSILIPAEGLDGMDVYWDYLPVGNYTVAVAAEDYYGQTSDSLQFDVTIAVSPAEPVAAPTINDTNFVVLYSGTPGSTYTVEATDSLSAPNWHKVTNLTAPTEDEGNGVGVFEFNDAITTSPQRYYRTVTPAY